MIRSWKRSAEAGATTAVQASEDVVAASQRADAAAARSGHHALVVVRQRLRARTPLHARAGYDGKGYRQEASRPDFLVKWHVSVESRPQSTPMATPTFRDVGPMPSAGSTSVPVMVTRQYREGTLILDIVDPGSDTVVWRGSAQAQLAGSGEPQTRQARIQTAVRRILERFPPQ